MRTIKGEPDSIANVASSIYSFSLKLREKQSVMEALKGEIPSYWKGEDATSFIDALDKENSNIGKYADAAENYADFLNAVAQGFDAIESDYGKKINVPKGG